MAPRLQFIKLLFKHAAQRKSFQRHSAALIDTEYSQATKLRFQIENIQEKQLQISGSNLYPLSFLLASAETMPAHYTSHTYNPDRQGDQSDPGK